MAVGPTWKSLGIAKEEIWGCTSRGSGIFVIDLADEYRHADWTK